MSDRLRLLHVFASSGFGGTERACLTGLRLMDPERFVHSVLFVNGRGPSVELYRPVAESSRALPGARAPQKLASLIRLAVEARPDVVLAYGLEANFLWRAAWMLHPWCRRPAYVLALRSTRTMQRRSRVLSWIDRRTTPCADLVFSNSRAGLASLKADGYPLGRTAIGYNGVDTDVFAPAADRAAAKAALGLAADQPVVICVAHLRPVKQHPLLLRAFAATRRAHPSAVLVLVGEDHFHGEVQRLTRELGLVEGVRILGQLTDPQVALKAADVFVLTSEREGLPGAILEAMATGLPVVATRVGGIPELVEDGVTGVLAGSDDVDGIARGMSRYLADPGLAGRAGALARQRACTHFSLGAMKAQWEAAALLSVTARKERPSGAARWYGGAS